MNRESDYLRGLVPESEEFIRNMEEYAEENRIPIMEKESMHFLKQLLHIKKCATVLEIGTAIGYSAIEMAHAHPEIHIVSIERDRQRYEEAMNNKMNSDVSERLTFHYGDALEMEEELGEFGPFDVLFIDAAKGQYRRFFELYAPLLTDDGIIISDNVLFKGLVANPDTEDKRMVKIADKIRTFNEWLTQLEDYDTSILPIGDGVALTTKRM
ncbi:O-methyltransferase [Salimicrobium flavidum]|uniref:tRNA 5-hydroxyuridine methyltransferase n=1 Tax=Salimicrobium flavidum TaxID=570947 RepID=A0A1N7IHZ0_9BACI|nr:O-methyltransferase [Salimicrobium flavidum]SIS36729.1 Predicted O-methyltransferase YrrM [Salimicrobium flavidum]